MIVLHFRDILSNLLVQTLLELLRKGRSNHQYEHLLHHSLTKKQSTMEKNYIFRKDLGEIMEELAEEALNHADTMVTKVIFRKGEISVCVYMNVLEVMLLAEQVMT